MAGTPWYKEKFPRAKYLRKGQPLSLGLDDLPRITNWVPVTEEQESLWEDSKGVVMSRNKKRDYLVEYDKKPVQIGNHYRMEVQILHVDYQGFIFVAVAPTALEVEMKTWPNVEKLIAHFLSPQLHNSHVQKVAEYHNTTSKV